MDTKKLIALNVINLLVLAFAAWQLFNATGTATVVTNILLALVSLFNLYIFNRKKTSKDKDNKQKRKK